MKTLRINRPNALWLIDASIYIYRPWYTGDPKLIDHTGQSIHAFLGFKYFVDQLLTRENPKQIAFAFDEVQTHSYRREIYPLYKNNRKDKPNNLRYQIKQCQSYIKHLGLPQESSNRYEADDIIASWASTSSENIIITADKDLTQLIRNQDLWCDYNKGISLNYKQIEKKFGVKPEQIADLLAIAGDKADNIPGVPGIGIATAAKLLRYFTHIENLLSSTQKISQLKFRGAHQAQLAIEKHQHDITLYRKLTGLQQVDKLIIKLRQ